MTNQVLISPIGPVYEADMDALFVDDDEVENLTDQTIHRSLEERVRFALEPTFNNEKFSRPKRKPSSIYEAVNDDVRHTDTQTKQLAKLPGQTGNVLLTNRVMDLTIIDIDVDKTAAREMIDMVHSMILLRLPEDSIVVSTPSGGLHIYCNTGRLYLRKNRVIDACSSTPYGSIVKGIDLLSSVDMFSKSCVMFAGSSAFSGPDDNKKWGSYKFVRGNLSSSINHGADAILSMLGFTLKKYTPNLDDKYEESKEQMDCSEQTARALFNGLKGVEVHANSAKNNGTTLYAIFKGINALPDDIVNEAYEFILTNCTFSTKAMMSFDERRDKYADESNPGCLINILKKHDNDYFVNTIVPLFKIDGKNRRIRGRIPPKRLPELNVINDSFKFQDIRAKCPYTDLNEAKYDLLRVFRVIDLAKEVYLIKEYDGVNDLFKIDYVLEDAARSKLTKIKVGVRKSRAAQSETGNKSGKENEKSITMWDIFLENTKLFYIDGTTFYSENVNVFNYFRGYEYSILETVKIEVIQPFLTHIHDVIADGNEDVYTYIIKWIASVLQVPNHKTEIALVLLGVQGTGKNVFTNVICKLMSRYAARNVTNVESVVGKFNAILENKKLIVLNEMQSADANKYLNSDALKSLFTENRIMINQKNIPEREAENVANFIICSNQTIPIKIEESDRRYMVTQTSDKYAGNREHFKELDMTFTAEFYENLFTYFMIQNVSEFAKESVPETAAKRNIKDASASTYDRFIREHYEEIVDLTGPEVYALYTSYCSSNGNTSYGSRTMLANINKYVGDTKSIYINKRKTKVYNILPKWIAIFKEEDVAIEDGVCNDDNVL